jgi:hypothetical protein
MGWGRHHANCNLDSQCGFANIWEGILAIANFCRVPKGTGLHVIEGCFGATPKPGRRGDCSPDNHSPLAFRSSKRFRPPFWPLTLFRGFPFPTGVSIVEQIDRFTGSHTTLIGNRTSAIDLLQIAGRPPTPGRNYLVLEHCSQGPFFVPPGLVLRFNNPASPTTLIADCLTQPTSMTLNKRTGTLYVSEFDGRVFVFMTGGSRFPGGTLSIVLPA